jgi:predicted nucleotidyltransferase
VKAVRQVVYENGRWDGKTPAEWVPEVVDAIVRAFDPLEIVLFGSIARGEAGPDSDIDLLVVLPRVEHRIEAAMAIRDAIAELPPPIDIVPTDPGEIELRRAVRSSVIHTALSEGRVVYERAA